MAVYVDDARNPWGRMLLSHMAADTRGELERMARRLGLQPEWFQGSWDVRDRRWPHYDLCQSKRREALRLGARPVTCRELIKVFRQQEGRRR
ncbi:MAG: DUF4031 domain-containing protein [bacterium]|nr:DUF4031 domain-containing protein [bacterium]